MALSCSAEGKQVGSTTGATEVVRKNGIKNNEENILEDEKKLWRQMQHSPVQDHK